VRVEGPDFLGGNAWHHAKHASRFARQGSLSPRRVRFSTGVSSCSGVLRCSKRCSLISKRVFCNKINGMGKNKGERFGVKGERFGVEGERFGVEGFEPSLAVENLKYCL
jgi:hypothetical protein